MKQGANKRSYWNVVSYPLSMWLLYLVIFFIASTAGLYRIGWTFLAGTGLLITSVLFGAWNGIASNKFFNNDLRTAALTGFLTGFIVGFFDFLLLAFSQLTNGFSYTLVSNPYLNPFSSSIINIGITAWLSAILLTMLSSAAAAGFDGRK